MTLRSTQSISEPNLAAAWDDDSREIERLVDDLFAELQRQRLQTAQAVAESAKLLRQLTQRDRELAEAHARAEQLSARFLASEAETKADHRRALERLEAALDESTTRSQALEKERAEAVANLAALATELDLARAMTADHKKRAAEARRDLLAERESLQEFKTLLGRIADRPVVESPRPSETLRTLSIPETSPVGAESPPLGAASPQAPGEAPADPLVHSVMAQFSKLQKDVARRRKKNP